jgi:extracellular factor (EF) 3-hydroxypalmitic acid methyl ester biosynthesis protein
MADSNTTNTLPRNSHVSGENSEGMTFNGPLFELYNPGAVLRFSESLQRFKIILQGRTVYSGEAVVRNLLVTESATVTCEAILSEELWVMTELSSLMMNRETARQGFQGFMREWQKLYRVMPEFKVVLSDMHSFLADLRQWLDQVELGARSLSKAEGAGAERDRLEEMRASIVPVINGLFDRFEAVAAKVDEELRPAHMAFGKRLLHPLLLASPFVNRTYTKPLGYAGDYEMVNMMFRHPYEGGSYFAKMVNAYALQLPPILAHRNRIDYLCNRLTDELLRLSRRHRPLRVFNLGCGPAHEIQKMLTKGLPCGGARLVLADFNEETLINTGNLLRQLGKDRTVSLEMVKRPVNQLIKQSERGVPPAEREQYDLVYCAGLFDYLSDKVCERLMSVFFEMLAPGGLLVATNVDVHPSRNEMEYFLEWYLIHRDSNRMRALVPANARPDQSRLLRDATGVNIFLEVRKDEIEQ